MDLIKQYIAFILLNFQIFKQAYNGNKVTQNHFIISANNVASALIVIIIFFLLPSEPICSEILLKTFSPSLFINYKQMNVASINLQIIIFVLFDFQKPRPPLSPHSLVHFSNILHRQTILLHFCSQVIESFVNSFFWRKARSVKGKNGFVDGIMNTNEIVMENSWEKRRYFREEDRTTEKNAETF